MIADGMTLDDTNRPRIAVVGSTMIDLIAYARRLPGPGETVVGDRFAMGFGGKGANQAVMARLLGADVAMINCLGDDAYGDMTLDNFASFGIDTSRVIRVAGASGVAPIWVEPDGSNRIIIVPGANAGLTPELAAESVTALGGARVVLGQLEIAQAVTAAGFREARALGATTILNPAPAHALDPDLLDATDWLIPNEVEFAALAGGGSADDDAAVRAFAANAGCRVVVTVGPRGAVLVAADGRVVRVAAPGVEALDTTGAGDAFVGAFAYALAAGFDERLAVELGCRCASDSVTRPGTQTSFPREERAVELRDGVLAVG